MHGGRDAGRHQRGGDEHDGSGAPQQAHPRPGPPGALRIRLGVAHGRPSVVVVVAGGARARQGERIGAEEGLTDQR